MRILYIFPVLVFSVVLTGCCNQKPKVVYRCAHRTHSSRERPAPPPSTKVHPGNETSQKAQATFSNDETGKSTKQPVVVKAVSSPVDEKKTVPKEKGVAKPGVKLIRTLGTISINANVKISQDDYIANGRGIYFFNQPFVYDIERNRRIQLNKLKPALKKYDNSQLVYFDGKKMEVGIKLSKRTGGDPVVCPCGKMRIPGQTRVYCKACPVGYKRKKIVDKTYYAQFSLKTNSMLWKVEIGSGTISSLGPDKSSENILFSKMVKAKHGRTVRYTFELFKISFQKRKIVWRYKISAPKRVVIGPYGFSAYASADLKKIFVWEHDEKYNQCTNGCLKNPPARGYIIDVKTKNHVTFRAPLTPYGHIFDKKSKFLYLSSFQKGKLYKISTASGKIVKTVSNNPGTFNFGFSKSEQYLYSFHKRGIIVFSASTLKPIRRYPLGKLFPGKKHLISVEFYQIFKSGYMAFRDNDKVKICKLLE